MRPPNHDELLREARAEYSYATAAPALPAANAASIGKFGAVTGVTMKSAAATKNPGGPVRSRQVVARFDLDGGDYPRLGMYRGANYVFLEHNNEKSQGAILTRAYYVVAENSPEIRYLIVDKRINVAPGPHGSPVALYVDPNQSFVFGGCVEGSFCPDNHCSITDAGDLY